MNLHEFQSKMLLSSRGVSVPKGQAVSTKEEARNVARDLKAAGFAVKAQIQAGARGRAGGVRLVSSPDAILCARSWSKPLSSPCKAFIFHFSSVPQPPKSSFLRRLKGATISSGGFRTGKPGSSGSPLVWNIRSTKRRRPGWAHVWGSPRA